MVLADQVELRRAIAIALSTGPKYIASSLRLGKRQQREAAMLHLVDHLTRELGRSYLFRPGQAHEMCLQPLPLFPEDRTHISVRRLSSDDPPEVPIRGWYWEEPGAD